MTKGKDTSRQKEETAVMFVIVVAILCFAYFNDYIGGDKHLSNGDEKISVPEAESPSSDEAPSNTLTPLGEIDDYNAGDLIQYSGFPQGKGWTGEVVKSNVNAYSIRIVEVNTGGPLINHLFPDVCTGGILLGQESAGTIISIPKACLKDSE
ncbi:MAG: hypothetical protein AAF502_07465 [Bacteroidota bacterium]